MPALAMTDPAYAPVAVHSRGSPASSPSHTPDTALDRQASPPMIRKIAQTQRAHPSSDSLRDEGMKQARIPATVKHAYIKPRSMRLAAVGILTMLLPGYTSISEVASASIR